MSIAGIAEWSGMMGSLITVHNTPSTTARTLFGVSAFSTVHASYAAHIMEVNGSNRRVTGIDEHVSSVAWIASTSTGNMSRTSKFTLPNGESPPVKEVWYVHDEDGTIHHTKVAFG